MQKNLRKVRQGWASRLFGRRLLVVVAALSLLLMAAKPALALTAPVLSYDTVTQTSVHLTWTDAGNEQSYRVYKDSVLLTMLGANVLSYTATNLTPSTTYAFRVDAKKGGQILPSNTVTVTTQSPPPPECSDGINNDPAEDTLIDYPADPGCTSPTDTSESPNPPPLVECNDGIDNDGDGFIDYPADPGCTSVTDTTEAPNPPPPTCSGVDVPLGTDLTTALAGDGAHTYCLHAGTYELGSTSTSYVHFDSGDIIVGQPVTFGPNGEVLAQTFIHGTSTEGVIQADTGDNTLTIDSLDICCSPGSGANLIGRGIDGNRSSLVNLTVLNSRIHGNGINGIAGVDRGLVVDHSEIDHNGAANNDGLSAGIKTDHYAEVRNSYFHDNINNGMWWDCDSPGGIIENTRITGNGRSGVYIEISSGDASSGETIPPGASYGFRVLSNVVDGNNPTNGSIHSGILVESSMNVTIDGNTTTNNNQYNINVVNDSRAGRGHNGCTSGFFVANALIQNNQYGPQGIHDTTLAGTTWINNTQILP
jgi:hypothetical protein